MGRIRILDSTLVDQIAAGEVVERPASVVKELVENALDAGADTVHVEIEGGGVTRIRVVDDGSGMSPQDAAMSVLRHATSKIATVDDLRAIHTYGFRGEALAAIAAVSRFELRTRERGADAATLVRVEGGSPPRIVDAAGPPGTVVEVRDLFFNVPARRKFLRSPSTEAAHAHGVLVRAALARPGLRLRWIRDGRVALDLEPAADEEMRARALLPGESLRRIEGRRDGVEVVAMLGPPERSRPSSADLHLLVNGRPVRDRALARTVAASYGSVMPPGRFPVGVVHLRVAPERVDVNVHPQKAEVRFADPRTVLDAVAGVLAPALGGRPAGVPSAVDSWRPTWSAGSWPRHGSWRDAGARHQTTGADDPLGLAAALRDATGSYGSGSEHVASAHVAEAPTELPAATSSPEPEARSDPSRRSPPTEPTMPRREHGAPHETALQPRAGFGSLRPVGVVRGTFLVCEGSNAVHFIDQHAADERVRYHRLRTAYARRDPQTQRLLLPERVELAPVEADALERHAEAIAAVGFDVVRVGPTTAAVHAVPALLARAAPDRLLHDLLAELERTGERAFGDALDRALATMACHAAIRAGDPLSLEQAAALLRALDEVPDHPGHCPHGRPVLLALPFSEIERRLGRA
ncbi:MAG: DNA mismatch repair endonuclease MutL [Myxococcota bacterium]|nr:DNA mismatch repair endonuclease MutL [Myxococcota bacterium]MDW8362698.1 DNA mismatch repair endonuclease MutL [Myxococcales bacterium]